MRAQVVETELYGEKILVGLQVTGRAASGAPDAGANRWQVLTVGRRGIVEIVGFDDRGDALDSAAAAGPRSFDE